MRHLSLTWFLAGWLGWGLAWAQAPIRGFPADQWKSQHEREEKASAIAQPDRIAGYLRHISEKPHHAGSPGDKAVVEYLVKQFKDWGLDVRVETFQTLIPYPTTRSLEMTAPFRFKAQLQETALPEDPFTNQSGQLPTFNAYSASGDVTGPLVYVNYGMPEDYAFLKSQGISVQGKIAIARYGKGWRGTKVKLAYSNGAVGCLLYSDPRDDGFFRGDAYPNGPMRPSQGVQRGSIVDMAIYPGDPLTPGWASEPGAKRLSREEAKVLPKIPAMPISWADAKPLLEQLSGPVAPGAWRGALPITYHLGPGPAVAHLKADFDWSIRPVQNVIVTIP